ncbi:hypothetical protein ABK040_010371 [Willaertia magna]
MSQQKNFIDPDIIIVRDDETEIDRLIKNEVIEWFNSFKNLRSANNNQIERNHLNSLLRAPRKELLNVMLNLNLLELNTQERMIVFDLNDSVFTIIYPETYKPTEGEGLLVVSEDQILTKVVHKANRFIQRDHASMGSPSIAISVLLSKIVEFFVTKSYVELTPGIKNITDDIFGKSTEVLDEEENLEDDDDDEDILQTPTPNRVNLKGPKSVFDTIEEDDLEDLIERLQHYSIEKDLEMFKAAWGTAAQEYVEFSLSAKPMLLSELKTLTKNNGKYGLKVELVDENIYVWTIHISDFPSETLLAKGLKEFHEKFNIGDGALILELRFGNYPDEPPHCRVVSPRLEYLTGFVQFDGTIAPDFLTHEHWKSYNFTKMENLIKDIKNILVQHDAKVDLRTFKPYDVKAAISNYIRSQRFNSTVIPTTNKFNEKYFIFSSGFSKRCFDSHLNVKVLEKGNKILLPNDAASKIFNQPNIEFPLIFEIKTRHGQRVYSGVSEFSASAGNVIVPEWMLRSLFLTEGAKIQIRSVSLPHATSLKIQPHSKTFYNINNYKQVLENTLSNYSCVTEGQSIQVYDEDEQVHMIQIVETQPQAAVSVLSDQGYLEVEIDFVPALDLDDDNELTKLQEQEKQKIIDKHEKIKQEVIEAVQIERIIKKENVIELLKKAEDPKEPVALVRFKFPDGGQVNKKFPLSAPCSVLYDYVETIDEPTINWRPLPYTTGEHIELATTFPKIDIPNTSKETLQSSRLGKQFMIVLNETDRFPPEIM